MAGRAAPLLLAGFGLAASVNAGSITAVDSYDGLVRTIGSANDANTGVRFTRDGIVMFHTPGKCEPGFDLNNLEGFLDYEDLYSLISVDTDHADQDLLQRFGIDTSDPTYDCPVAVLIDKRSLVASPSFSKPEPEGAERGQRHFYGAVVRHGQVSVAINNELQEPVDVWYGWWNDELRPTGLDNIGAGDSMWFLSFKTTLLVAYRAGTREEVGRQVVTGHGLFTVSNRNCTAEDCGVVLPREKLIVDEQLEKEFAHADAVRVINNRVQARDLPKFTETGFKKIQVPDDAWDLIWTYYQENKDKPEKEAWSRNNVFTNNVEAPSYMVTLPENGVLKASIFDKIRPVLEEWSGTELTQTSAYGIRVYTNGSWLANHVDTRQTHAVSAIIQVDQEVDEDWQLMIFDHDGQDHNITMRPRDMVLYESATCVHGRPTIFKGKFYANTFVHYMPTDPKRWDVQ